MRIPLTQDRAQSFHDFLELLLIQWEPENIAEKLIEDHMKDVYERLRRKVKGAYTKDYSLTLNPKEEKAYYIFFNQNKISIGYQYEQLMAQSHINLIDKIYA
jgi:predicted Zn-ribbon and HTH transcriptional regulator